MHRRGFTLIEMLVVIGIIMILAGLLLPAISLARAFARKATAKSEIENIAAAWMHYYSEYQRWPSFVSGETPVRIADDVADALSAGALGIDNPRRIKFMGFKRFNLSTNPVTPWARTEVTDADTPEKHYYYVMFDANFDNKIDATTSGPPSWDMPTTEDVNQSVIVWTVNDDADEGSDKWIIGSWQE